MRLEPSLIKEILEKVEALPIDSIIDVSDLDIGEYSEDQIRYHLVKFSKSQN